MSADQESGPAYVHLNGSLTPAEKARVSVFDHGLLYADGLFETLRVANGRCFRPEAHLDRLDESAARLALLLPWTRPQLLAALQETATANQLHEGGLRLTVTRGTGAPIPDPSVCPEPTYFITARRVAPVSAEAFERGLRLGVGPQHPRLFVPGIKSLCFLPYQLARMVARAEGCDDAVLLYGEHVVETGISNVFLVKDGVLTTPDTNSGCLPGTTRALLLELAAQLAIPTEERAVPLSELRQADEVWVTNSLVGVLPIREVAGQPIRTSPGPVTRALQAAYAEVLRRETT
jgi:branched-chain amino acid aminotransferase